MLCLHLFCGCENIQCISSPNPRHTYVSVCPLLWFLLVGMLIWPQWLGKQNNYGYFCLMQHIKSQKQHGGWLLWISCRCPGWGGLFLGAFRLKELVFGVVYRGYICRNVGLNDIFWPWPLSFRSNRGHVVWGNTFRHILMMSNSGWSLKLTWSWWLPFVLVLNFTMFLIFVSRREEKGSLVFVLSFWTHVGH